MTDAQVAEYTKVAGKIILLIFVFAGYLYNKNRKAKENKNKTPETIEYEEMIEESVNKRYNSKAMKIIGFIFILYLILFVSNLINSPH